MTAVDLRFAVALALGSSAGSLAAPALAQTLQLPRSQQEDQAPPAPAPVLTKAPTLREPAKPVLPPPELWPRQPDGQPDGGPLDLAVGLELDLSPTGAVTAARIVKPVAPPFDQAAQDAALQLRFSPAELDGKPAAVTIGYTLHFTLSPPERGAADGGLGDGGPSTRALAHLVGQVLERASKKALPGVSLTVDANSAHSLELASGPDGRFALELTEGPHQISVFAPGYQPVEKRVTPEAGQKIELTIYLRPQIEGLFQTVIRAEAEKDVVVVYTLDREQLRRAPGTFGDPLHVITDLPGVARTPFDLGFLIVRGADPNDTIVYLDGLQIPLLYHFGGGPAVINPEFVDRIDFYPGGQGAKYGNAIGGTVDVTSRQLKPDGFHANADVNIAFAQAFAELALPDDWVVAAAGRRSYFDLAISPFLKGGTVIIPYFWDYQVKADHGKPGDRNTFGVMAYGSNDTLHVLSQTFGSSQAGLDINYNTQFHRLVGHWNYHDDNFSSSLRPMLGLENVAFSGGANLSFKAEPYTAALRHDMAYKFSDQNTLNFGEDFAYTQFNASVGLPSIQNYAVFPGSSVQESQQDLYRLFNGLRLGFWAEDVIKLRPNFSVIPGLRLDGWLQQGHGLTSADPRVVVRWGLTPKLTLKGSLGIYHEAPALQNFDSQFGNPNLQLLTATQVSGGFEYTLIPPLHLDMTGFFSDRSGLLAGSLAPSAPGTVPITNTGIGRAYGLEVYLHHDITPRLFGWLSYTLSRAEQTFGANQQWFLSTFDETHILSAVLSYNLGAGFILGGRYRFVTGTPITPIASSTYDSDQDLYIPVNGATDSQRLGNYSQLDLRLDKEFSFERWKLDLYLDVWNVLNTSNEELRVYDYRNRQYASLPGYPILPLLGLRGEY